LPLNAQSIGYFGLVSGDAFSLEELNRAEAFCNNSSNLAIKCMSIQSVAAFLKDPQIRVEIGQVSLEPDDETLDEKFDKKRKQSATLAKQVDSRLGLNWGAKNKRWLEVGGARAEAADFGNLDKKILWMKKLLIEHSQSHVRNP
jgi:hypothetical protein